MTGSREAHARITGELCRDALAISAVTGQGIPQLIQRIVAMLDEGRNQPVNAEALSVSVADVAVSSQGE